MTYGILLLLTAPTYAQSFGVEGLETRFSLEFSANVLFSQPVPPTPAWELRGDLETRYARDAWSFNLALNPGLQVGPRVFTDWGLSEAYALYRWGDLDLSAGFERIPLEVARLSVPYSLEAVSPLGQRQGKLGARLTWNPENTRLRLAFLENPNGWFGLASLRHEFAGFELEAHLLAPSGQLVFGLGGSGTLENLVVYGEVWGLLPQWRFPQWRYALGLSGNLGEGLWTLEGGYASPLPGQPPRRFAAAQVSQPVGLEASWSAVAQLFFDPDGLRSRWAITYNPLLDAQEATYTVFVQLGPELPSGGVRVAFKLFPE
ncbi:MAG TPA: hypothetical protein VFS50_08190 [Meiothermus sp.]|nr:hypothetical protein [Meiothermus sp.]